MWDQPHVLQRYGTTRMSDLWPLVGACAAPQRASLPAPPAARWRWPTPLVGSSCRGSASTNKRRASGELKQSMTRGVVPLPAEPRKTAKHGERCRRREPVAAVLRKPSGDQDHAADSKHDPAR